MIVRDPHTAAQSEHDLIVIGGGIYGACLTLEAARRGLRPLLLERGDFGEATSWNSLRIVHGGFRYLQTLDLRRFRESVRERRWFCRTFPELVRPQECLMPLYGSGLKRRDVFAAAIAVNDLLSWDRNRGVHPARRLAPGRVLTAAETIRRFPLVDRRGLDGGGLWHDAVLLSSQRVLIEILHWACSLGATALNYVEAVGLERRGGRVGGVAARDRRDGRSHLFSTRAVCNCAGPWSAELAARFDRPAAQLFRPSLAFNVLLDCDPPSESAVAVAAREMRDRSPVYFLYPAFGGLFAGTVHLPWQGGAEQPRVSEADIQRFLADLNAAIPGMKLKLEHVRRVFAGLLPATESGTANLAVRPMVRDHGREGGLRGLVSVSGVKFTTARLVAETGLAVLRPYLGALPRPSDAPRPALAQTLDFERADAAANTSEALQATVRHEAVTTVDDLLFRRTNWAITARNLGVLRRRLSDQMGFTPMPAHAFARPVT